MSQQRFTRPNTGMDYYNCSIQAGEIVISRDPSWIYAVCGNGVLVLLRDKALRIGGVAHCVFPRLRFREKPTNYHTDIAVHSLIMDLQRNRSSLRNIEAQILGGGHYHGHEKRRAEKVIKRVKKILKRKKITIISEDVGGCLGRKVVFNTHSGEVVVYKTRHIRRTDWTPERTSHARVAWPRRHFQEA